MISFSGYRWQWHHSPFKKKAPGPNYWHKNALWVDEKGYLHLKIVRDPKTKHWYCAALQSIDKMGLGRYEFELERLPPMDKNVVFGLFSYSGIDFFDEVDIEFSQWGKAGTPNLHYTVYPAENSSAQILQDSLHFMSSEKPVIFSIIREKDRIIFEQKTTEETIDRRIFRSDAFSQKSMPVFINLWLFQHQAPSDGQAVEMVIRKFQFSPL